MKGQQKKNFGAVGAMPATPLSLKTRGGGGGLGGVAYKDRARPPPPVPLPSPGEIQWMCNKHFVFI